MITRAELREIFANGIWKQNSSLAQTLGLCPLLAVTTTLVNGAMLSLATLLVTALSGFSVSCLRKFIPHEIRMPIFIMIAATLVTIVDQCMASWLSEIHNVLGIFIPLIITNCIVFARIEAFAAKNGPIQSFFDGISMGIGMLWTLVVLGGLRELLGSGTLFSGVESIIPSLSGLRVFGDDYPGAIFFVLPPGAFILLAFMIAAKNALSSRRSDVSVHPVESAARQAMDTSR
ncbi:MAG: electron transport complex subunit E [Candidatus Accumulibacter sp.]|jgi:electron transport complex protein RnfE|nr:electron transport complex subunit E [Accumulibacter sp.]